MKNFCVIALAALFGSVPAAASSGIGGPLTGFVFDARLGAIRPINGMPGASVMGSPVLLPMTAAQAAISSKLDFALAVSADDRLLYLVRGLSGPNPASTAVPGALVGAQKLELNEPGTAAVLYDSVTGKLQVVSGLPDNPSAGPPLDAAAGGSELAVMALSADGTRIAAGFSGDPGGIYEFFADGSAPRLLAQAHAVGAIAFSAGGRNVLYANQATNEIMSIRDIEGDGEITVLAHEADGVSKPVGLRAVNADREIWVANSGSDSLLIIDSAASGVASIALAGAPTRCDVLDGGSLLVLNDAGAEPLLLADWANGRAAYFVPAPQTEGQQ